MVGTSADDNGSRGAVEFGERDHHGRLDRRQPARAGAPVGYRLELRGKRADIGNIEGLQHLDGAFRIVEGRATDERKAGQGNKRVDGGRLAAHEKAPDRRAGIKPAGKGRDDADAARFESLDDTVIVTGIARRHIGAHHQQTDGRLMGRRFRQRVEPLGHLRGKARMVEPRLGILFRRRRVQCAPEMGARAGGVAVHQEAHGIRDVLFRTRQPVLHRDEVGAHVLRDTRNIAQDLRQTAQRLHLLLAGARLVAGAAQALHQRDGSARRLRHVEPAHARQLNNLGRRHAADHCIARLAPRQQCGHDRAGMLLDEQHRGDDDVGAADVRNRAVQRARNAVPVAGGMEIQRHRREGAAQIGLRGHHRAAEMRVERQDDNPDGRPVDHDGALTGHSSPLHHRGSRA